MARSHGALYRTVGEFLSYLKERHVKRVIDAGVDAIFMEEPEFGQEPVTVILLRRNGKILWLRVETATRVSGNTYLSSKLKYYLYYRALNEVFTFAKEYGKAKGWT